MRVLQIGSDRSKRGVLVPGSPAHARQKAYAENFGALDLIGYSLRSDGFTAHADGALRTYPTNAPFKLLYGTWALGIASGLPKPDVVSAQDPADTGLLALWIARIRRVPLHIQVHTDIFAESYGAHSLANRVRQRIARFVLARAQGIRVVSDRVKESVLQTSGHTLQAKISVLPIFVDVAKFRAAQAPDGLASRFAKFRTKVLFIGRLEPEKNAALAIEAFAQSAPEDACLIIVGNGSERKKLASLVHEKKIAERVFFEGEREAVAYYPFVDLVLSTSAYEGYGQSIVEALAAGKPVLARDVGIARNAGAIIAEGDFAEALSKWFEAGPRTGSLSNYPYRDFADYVRQYCDDVRRLV